MNRRLRIPLLLAAIIAPHATAMFMQPQMFPADRLIENTKAHIKENPEDHKAHYTLGRIHYLAFSNQMNLVQAFNEEKPPSIAPDWMIHGQLRAARESKAREEILKEMGYDSPRDIPRDQNQKYWEAVRAKQQQLEADGWKPKPLTQEQVIEHILEADAAFTKAMELSPDNGLYDLGLASLYRQYLTYVEENKIDKSAWPEPLNKVDESRIKDLYLSAYRDDLEKANNQKFMPVAGLSSLVSYEAGDEYLKMVEKEGEVLDEETKKTVAEIKETIARLKQLPHGPITPLIFTFEDHSGVNDLLAPQDIVEFDLDGDGGIEEWSWIKPTTGFLVWDPAESGKITSGRQLFGTGTWWMLYEDGYKALAALDDTGDGQISHGELDGLSVWFDKNGNAVSEPGEVTTLHQLGVEYLSVQPDGKDGGMLTSKNGLTLKNGKTLPTYDWVTSPLERKPALPLRLHNN